MADIFFASSYEGLRVMMMLTVTTRRTPRKTLIPTISKFWEGLVDGRNMMVNLSAIPV